MENRNKIIITILSIIIVVLIGYIIYDKTTSLDINNEEANNSNNKNIISKFAGSYQYGEKINDSQCNGTNKLDGTSYHYLELKSDGSYTYQYGTNCGGGESATGNYAINNNKIYLFNDNCEIALIDNQCTYPNCNKTIELNYSQNNNIINISTGSTLLEKNN